MVDETWLRFGMREFTVKENRFYLNNHPIFVRAVLHQPDYARSLAAPESTELARRELQHAKDAGFNMVRLHIKTAPKITLELADEPTSVAAMNRTTEIHRRGHEVEVTVEDIHEVLVLRY